MMVAKDEKEGLVQGGYDKIKVIHGKIPGGKDDVHICVSLLYAVRIDQGIDLIRNAEYLHGFPAVSFSSLGIL